MPGAMEEPASTATKRPSEARAETETLRQTIRRQLLETPHTARELSTRIGPSEKDVAASRASAEHMFLPRFRLRVDCRAASNDVKREEESRGPFRLEDGMRRCVAGMG